MIAGDLDVRRKVVLRIFENGSPYLIYLFSLVLLPLSIDGRIATVFSNASHKYVFLNPSKKGVLSTSGMTSVDDTIFVITAYGTVKVIINTARLRLIVKLTLKNIALNAEATPVL